MVKIRPWYWTDADRLTSLLNNKNIWDNTRDYLPFPYTMKDADTFLQKHVDKLTSISFAILWHGQLAGGIGYLPKDDVYRCSAEIGYWVGETFWGKGIATEAVGLLIEKIKGLSPQVIRVYAEVFDHNKASMRTLEKNGFYLETIRKKAVIKNNKVLDDYVWVRLMENEVLNP
jgi:[ribosomal protein S5]-alanine N-acetyltransferase